MVTKLDRISRKLLDLLNLIDLFQEHNVSFNSISESFDTNTPSGRLTLQVLSAVAEFERERIRERVFENMYHAASGGKWLTQSPYVYKGTLVWNRTDSSKKKRTEKDDREWVVIDECLPAIIDEDIWEQVQKGVGSKQIAPRAKTNPGKNYSKCLSKI